MWHNRRVKPRGWTGTLIAVFLCAACGGSTTPSTGTPPPTDGGVQITGGERLAWGQPGASVAGYQFALYVDGATRVALGDAACTPASEAMYDCQSSFPALSRGAHTLELAAAVVIDGQLTEGPRSGPVQVTVVSGSAAGVAPRSGGAPATTIRFDSPAAPVASPGPAALPVNCGVSAWPGGGALAWYGTDALDIWPSGADRGQRVEWRQADDEAMRLGAAVADSGFALNRFVYLVLLSNGSDGTRVRVERYRELARVLGERRILLDRVVDFTATGAWAGSGSDGSLLVALLSPETRREHPFTIRFDPGGSLRANADGLTFDPRVTSTAPVAATFTRKGDLAILERSSANYAIRTVSASGELLGVVPLPGSADPPVAIAPVVTASGADALAIVDVRGTARLSPDRGRAAVSLVGGLGVDGVAALGPTLLAACGSSGGDVRVVYVTWRG